MRIALLNQFFWPDAIATSQLLTDLARGLAREHDVYAICGSNGTSLTQSAAGSQPDVILIRVLNVGFHRRDSQRLASYISYLAGALWHGIRLPRFDSYLTLTTPPTLPIIGSVLGTICRAQHIIWEMDVYPDIASDIGYFRKNGILDRITGKILDWSRHRATAIIVLGDDMKARLVARGISESKIHVAENWADGTEITPQPFPKGPLIIHYSGNFGRAHEIDTIVDVISRLRNHPDFRFVFAGGGPRKSALEEFCIHEKIHNVEFPPYCARTELGASLANSHLGLVTQLPQTLGSVVPSKTYGIMAAGRPLLYIGPDGSTPASHIRRFNCGWHIQPGDAKGLESLLIYLCENRHILSQFGSRARTAFEQNFDRTIGVTRVLNVIEGQTHRWPQDSQLIESIRGD